MLASSVVVLVIYSQAINTTVCLFETMPYMYVINVFFIPYKSVPYCLPFALLVLYKCI